MENLIRQLKPYALVSCALAVALSGALAQAKELGAHVHGTAILQVAVEGDSLFLDMDTPLDNLVGFEHEPRDDKQKSTVRKMAQALRDAARLFVPTPAARCTLLSVHLESSVLDPNLLGESAKPKHAHEEEAGHADLGAEYVFRCANPKQLHDLEVKVFDTFRDLHQIDVQFAGPRGQAAAKLNTKQRRFAW